MFKIKTLDEIKALSAADLKAYILEGKRAARDIVAEDDVTDEQIADAQAIVDSTTEAQTVLTGIEAADAERVEKAKALRDALGEEETEETEGEGEEPAAEVEVPDDASEIKEPVVAAARTITVPVRKSAVERAGERQAKPEAPAARPVAAITAAADVPGYSGGQTVEDISGITDGVMAVVASLARSGSNAHVEKGIATITLPRTDGLSTKEFGGDHQGLMDAARNERRLASSRGQGSLIAAGGWCAPSETLYDLCGSESLDGLFDVPEVQVDRGGLNFTKGPQFADFYAGASIAQTEAQAISGTAKTCVTIACPTFTDVRLDVIGVCISVPILTNAAYPELVTRWTQGTLAAHAHRKSISLLNRALTIAGSAQAVANPWPTASGSILAAIELVVLGERQRYRLGESETLEAVFPMWVKGAIRADLSIRSGVDLINVNDATILQYFAVRGVRAQFVWGWQDLVLTGTGTPNGPGVALDYPATLEVLVYPAGSLVAGTKDVITLNGVYDSTGLAANTYTALFTEEGISLMNPCHTVQRISIALKVSGLTANTLINQDYAGTAPLLAGTAIPLA